MKVYRRDHVDGYRLYVGEVEDGAECIAVDARPEHRDEEPIDSVDYDAKVFTRRGGQPQPFPERWYHPADVVWTAA